MSGLFVERFCVPAVRCETKPRVPEISQADVHRECGQTPSSSERAAATSTFKDSDGSGLMSGCLSVCHESSGKRPNK